MRGMEGQNLVVCGGHDTVCAWAREWASNSSDFCSLAGFHLEGLDTRFGNGAQMVCYDAKLETVTALSEKEKQQTTLATAMHKNLKDQLKEESQEIEALQSALSKEKALLQDSMQEVEALKRELQQRDLSLSDTVLKLQLKETDLVGSKLELQQVKFEFVLCEAHPHPERYGLASSSESCPGAADGSDSSQKFTADQGQPTGPSNGAWWQEFEAELEAVKETLQEKGSQLLEAQHLLVNKDQKLKQLVDCLDTHETELVKMREKVKEKPEIPTRLYMATHLQEQFGDSALEQMQLQVAKMEVKGSSSMEALHSLVDLNQGFLEECSSADLSLTSSSSASLTSSVSSEFHKCIPPVVHADIEEVEDVEDLQLRLRERDAALEEILAAHGMESLHVQKFVQQSMGGVVVALQDFILFD
ncbi:unnamed protein product [Sphagnum jensenii]